MQTLHVKTNEQIMTRILDFINTLSREGADIELVDDRVYAFEKGLIDRGLQDIRNGETYSIEEVEQELLRAD